MAKCYVRMSGLKETLGGSEALQGGGTETMITHAGKQAMNQVRKFPYSKEGGIVENNEGSETSASENAQKRERSDCVLDKTRNKQGDRGPAWKKNDRK